MNDIEAHGRTLIPFDRREAISIREAAKIAGKSERTLRNWCVEHGIGRRVAGGTLAVSRVALAMLLDDRRRALRDYLAGARRSSESVAEYYRRADLGDLLDRQEFAV